MKYNKIITALVALVLGMASCSDVWDEHYATTTVQSDGSLWENIKSNSDLSNFAYVIESCYHSEVKDGALVPHEPTFLNALKGDQVFTVFAPTNEALSMAEAQALVDSYFEQDKRGVKESENTVVKEFIQNHIALYNYSVAGNMSESTISMMNGKYLPLTATTFAGNELGTTNVSTSNGVLFTIDRKAVFKPNVMEALLKDTGDNGIDSLAKYIYQYNLYELLPEQSVAGDIVDGEIVYLDSVTRLKNEILDDILTAKINNEDSTYWMVVPTNSEWNRLVAEYEPYFQYEKIMNKKTRDSLTYNFARRSIIEGTVFSLTRNRVGFMNDSVVSTNAVRYNFRDEVYGQHKKGYYQYDKPFEAGGVFTDVEETECSNGKLLKSANWKVDKHDTFFRPVIVEAESGDAVDSISLQYTLPLTYRSVPADNEYYGKVSRNGYVEITSQSANYGEVFFNVPNLLSNVPYEVKLVVVPPAIDTLLVEELVKPTAFRSYLFYHDMETGEEVGGSGDYRFGMSYPDYTRLDTIVLKTITIPTSSYGVAEPQVRLRLQVAADTDDESMTSTLRLDCIIFEPKEVSATKE